MGKEFLENHTHRAVRKKDERGNVKRDLFNELKQVVCGTVSGGNNTKTKVIERYKWHEEVESHENLHAEGTRQIKEE